MRAVLLLAALVPALHPGALHPGAVRDGGLEVASDDLPGPVPAMGEPAPEIRVRWGSGPDAGLVVRVAPPPGWSLYAPRTPTRSEAGEGAGEGDVGADGPLLGLPLEARHPGGGILPLRGVRPEPEVRREPGGRTRVYREPVELFLAVPDPAPTALDLRWAVCREDRCIPGRTRVPVPPRTSRHPA